MKATEIQVAKNGKRKYSQDFLTISKVYSIHLLDQKFKTVYINGLEIVISVQWFSASFQLN